MNEVIEIPKDASMDEAFIIIENRLNAHLENVLTTVSVKLDRVLEVHAKLDELLNGAKALMEEMEKSPLMAMVKGGNGLPGFGDFFTS